MIKISVKREIEPGSGRFVGRELHPPVGSGKRRGYAQLVQPNQKIEIGNGGPLTWKIDGGPLIQTPDGRNTIIIGVSERYDAVVAPKSLDESRKVLATIDVGNQLTEIQSRFGLDPEKVQLQVPSTGNVEYDLGKTPDGKACKLVFEQFEPRNFEHEEPQGEQGPREVF